MELTDAVAVFCVSSAMSLRACNLKKNDTSKLQYLGSQELRPV